MSNPTPSVMWQDGEAPKDACQMSNALREANVTVIDRKICNDAQHYNFLIQLLISV